MTILALEFSSARRSAALARGGTLLAEAYLATKGRKTSDGGDWTMQVDATPTGIRVVPCDGAAYRRQFHESLRRPRRSGVDVKRTNRTERTKPNVESDR